MPETGEDLRDVIKRVYALGYDVGYHHHSEIGWISTAYNDLVSHVDETAQRELLRRYYELGKKDGNERRKHDIQIRSEKKVGRSAESTQYDYDAASAINTFLQQPQVLAMPGCIMQTKLFDQPFVLRGFIILEYLGNG
ncbi:MAG: hypothetical protein ACXQTY_03965 [Candidatus Methanogasteraceae archaeon]